MARGQDVFDATADIVIADELRAFSQPRAHSEDNVTCAPMSAHGRMTASSSRSGAGAHLDMIDSFAFSTGMSPRSRDKGLLKPDFIGDVTIFEPDRIADGEVDTRYDLSGLIEHCRVYAEAIGSKCVIVAGLSLGGADTIIDARSGMVLRSGRDTEPAAINRVKQAA